MSGDDSFLARWSRRKRRLASGEPKQRDQRNDCAAIASDTPAHFASSQEIKPPFDPQNLPSIESIGPDSDVRAFLASEVPADLRRMALRRLWSLDPKIRDFVGLSENSWDFNAPDAIPGFGPIGEEQARTVLARLLGGRDIEAVASGLTNIPHQVGELEVGRFEGPPLEELESGQGSGAVAPLDLSSRDTLVVADDVSQLSSATAGSQCAFGSRALHRSARRKGSALPE